MEENVLNWLFLFLGRFHPLAVHFPIGLLVTALLLEGLTLKGKRPGLREGINWMVYLGAISSILSAILGWLLSTFDNYTGDLLDLHKNLGILTAVLASVTAYVLYKTQDRKTPNLFFYRSGLLITVITLSITGHLGASLTHGEDFISSVLQKKKNVYSDVETVALLNELKPLDSLSVKQKDALNLEVRAVLAHNCYQCHSVNKQKGELVLDNKRGVFKGGESGEIIVAGQPEESEIYKRITLPSNHDDVMPKKGKVLKDSEIELIRLWIKRGAHWADQALNVFPEATLALTKPELPEDATHKHPIDRFVFNYLDENKIKPSELIDDRTFLRRVYLDILGLLPTIAEIDLFLKDTSPDKREKLIDQLLNDDKNYTENWLSFWNDLLRNDYSGTGFITGGRKQITDWLYNALMENKPYDVMVKELMNPTAASEGFIKGIQWRGVVNASQRTEMQAAQNVGQALMGMNVKCASCHNSFVSNLTLGQAYGFATIFSDSILELNRCDKPIGKMAKVNFLYPSLGSVDGSTVAERLEKLSKIIVKPENGRLYRTLTNRIWKRFLGRGIVEPVDEMDNAPWDADLLDWLAINFIESGCDLKELMRTIMTSKTYQMSSVHYSDIAEIKSKTYQFQGPTIRRISAEQFSDAVSQIIAPVFYATAYNPNPNKLFTNRIWHRERKFDRDVLPDPGKRFFRYKFNLSVDDVKSAKVLVSVDDAYVLFINEQKVLSGNNWKNVDKIDVTKHLNKGENIIAIEADNLGLIPKPAGILFALKMINHDKSEILITSNTDWLSTNIEPNDQWKSLNYDDGLWEKTKNFGSNHWGELLDFSFEDNNHLFARASMVKQHPFLKALGRPSRENITTTRDEQATLLQALELSNGSYFNSVLETGASNWLERHRQNSGNIADILYLKALGRKPSKKEKKIMLLTLGEQPKKEAVQDLFWATLLLPEFQFIY